MIAADTSSLIAFFAGETKNDALMVEKAIEDNLLVLLPPVLSEILSDPKLPGKIERVLKSLPSPETKTGFWERIGGLRKSVLKKKRKARLADALIAQFCIDYNLALITRDSDIKNFAAFSDLILL